MPSPDTSELQSKRQEPINTELALALKEIAEKCTHCSKCQRECAFLTKSGTPGQLAKTYLRHYLKPDNISSSEEKPPTSLPYQCNLCALCTSICPVDLEPNRMFLELRREAVREDTFQIHKYRQLLSFERIGKSELFRYSHFPENCDTVFFPGCALPGIRPDHTLKIFKLLRQHKATTGIMLDCCLKPSHDLGRQVFFATAFNQLVHQLSANGIKKVITGCPNCYQTFKQYAAKTLNISTIYTELDELRLKGLFNPAMKPKRELTIHDPCTTRFHQDIHHAVRELSRKSGITLREMDHNRATTFCCGEGGAVGCVGTDFTADWSERRHGETKELPLITYCAGCTVRLKGKGEALHLTDLIFSDLRSSLLSRLPARPPFTYLNRLLLKRKLRRITQDRRRFSSS